MVLGQMLTRISGPRKGLGSPCQSRLGGPERFPRSPLSPSPRYLYPDGKNYNPDLTELCRTEPYQRIQVSEVSPRLCLPAHHPPFCIGSRIPSHGVRPGVPEALISVLAWWPCGGRCVAGKIKVLSFGWLGDDLHLCC